MASKKFGRWLTASGLVGGVLLSSLIVAGPATASETQQTVSSVLADVSISGVTASTENAKKATALQQSLLDAANPAEEVSRLSPSDKALLKASLTVIESAPVVVSTVPVKTAPAGATKLAAAPKSTSTCAEMTAYTESKSVVGISLYKVWIRGGQCWTNSRTTDAWFITSWVSDLALGWRDGGQLYGGARAFTDHWGIATQRQMHFGIAGWDPENPQPCVGIWVNLGTIWGSDGRCRP